MALDHEEGAPLRNYATRRTPGTLQFWFNRRATVILTAPIAFLIVFLAIRWAMNGLFVNVAILQVDPTVWLYLSPFLLVLAFANAGLTVMTLFWLPAIWGRKWNTQLRVAAMVGVSLAVTLASIVIAGWEWQTIRSSAWGPKAVALSREAPGWLVFLGAADPFAPRSPEQSEATPFEKRLQPSRLAEPTSAPRAPTKAPAARLMVPTANATETAVTRRGTAAAEAARTLSRTLGYLATSPTSTAMKEQAENYMYRAQAEAKGNESQQAASLRELLPRVKEAIDSGDREAISTLQVLLSRIE